MKLVHLIDSHEYVRDNCWQHQLRDHLVKQCDVHVELTKTDLTLWGKPIPDADVVLSTLKLRSIQDMGSLLREKLGSRQIYVYEQDPWEAFVDTASYPGAYHALDKALNVTFINTSLWWSDYVKSRGMRSIFTRMWVKSGYCSEGMPWSSRRIRVGFKGTVHPHRRRAIEELRGVGVEVTVLPPGNYSSFLQDLSHMQFFFHEEAGERWTIGGKPIEKNCGWAKEIEIASQGCFALRKWEDEAKAYDFYSIPGIVPFNDISEVPRIIADALKDPDRSSQRSQNSVDFIRRTPGWFQLRDLSVQSSA